MAYLFDLLSCCVPLDGVYLRPILAFPLKGLSLRRVRCWAAGGVAVVVLGSRLEASGGGRGRGVKRASLPLWVLLLVRRGGHLHSVRLASLQPVGAGVRPGRNDLEHINVMFRQGGRPTRVRDAVVALKDGP